MDQVNFGIFDALKKLEAFLREMISRPFGRTINSVTKRIWGNWKIKKRACSRNHQKRR